jgi:hypothetical protein
MHFPLIPRPLSRLPVPYGLKRVEDEQRRRSGRRKERTLAILRSTLARPPSLNLDRSTSSSESSPSMESSIEVFDGDGRARLAEEVADNGAERLDEEAIAEDIVVNVSYRGGRKLAVS